MALREKDSTAEFPYYFLKEQTIFQTRVGTADSQPRYSISLAWVRYRVEADGTIVYGKETGTYYDDDFYAHAVQHAAESDFAFVDGLSAMQLAVKKIIEDEMLVQLEVV